MSRLTFLHLLGIIYYESPGQRLNRWASLLAQMFRHWTGKPV